MTRVPDLEALFRAERAAAPAATAAERGWLKLSRDLAAHAPPLAVASGPLKPVSWLIAKWLLSGVAIGLAGAGVVAVATPRAASVAPAASVESRAVVSIAPVAASTHAEVVSVAPAAASVSASAALAQNGSAASAAPSASAPAEAATFDAELALISRAKSELDARQFSSAEATLREHAARFAQGVFATERDGLLVLVSCERGPKDPNLARSFENAHPGAALSARLVHACGVAPSVAPSAVVDFSRLPNEPSRAGEPTSEPRTGKQP